MSYQLSIWHGVDAVSENQGTYPTFEAADKDAVAKSQGGKTCLVRDATGFAVKAYRDGRVVEVPEGANADDEVVDSDAKTKVR